LHASPCGQPWTAVTRWQHCKDTSQESQSNGDLRRLLVISATPLPSLRQSLHAVINRHPRQCTHVHRHPRALALALRLTQACQSVPSFALHEAAGKLVKYNAVLLSGQLQEDAAQRRMPLDTLACYDKPCKPCPAGTQRGLCTATAVHCLVLHTSTSLLCSTIVSKQDSLAVSCLVYVHTKF
jgi:hypothetical protein